MRLIDADAPDLGHCKGGEVCGVVFVRLNDVALAIKNTPTIDPIHAAGGCYCQECIYSSYDAEYNKRWCNLSGCREVRTDGNGYCDLSKRKDGQNG